MNTQAAQLAAALNSYDGDNWAQDVDEIELVDEEQTRADGFDPDRMGDPGVETTMFDGSAIRYSGGLWVEA